MYLSLPIIMILIVVLFGLLIKLSKYKAAISELHTSLEIINHATHFTDQAQSIVEAINKEGVTLPVSLDDATGLTQGFIARAEPFISETGITFDYTKSYYQEHSNSMKEQREYTVRYTRAMLDGLYKVLP